MPKISLKQGGYSVSGKSAKFGVAKGENNYVSRISGGKPEAPVGSTPAPSTPAPATNPTQAPSPELKALSMSLAPKSPDPVKDASAPAPADTTTPTGSKPSPYYPRYTKSAAEQYLENNAFTAPKSEEQIQREKLRGAQAEINSINQYTADLLNEQKKVNDASLDATRSTNVLSGLAGSSEANTATARTMKENADANKVIQDRAQVQIQGILSDIRKSAAEEAKAQREEARLGAQASVELQDKQRMRANEQAMTLAASGATADGFKKTDPQGYQFLAEKVGGEETLKAIFTLNRPVDSIIDKKLEGGKYVIAYQNPITGKVSIETVDTGLPVGYSKTIDAGDRILAVPDNWSGDPSELVTINKGLTPGQARTAAGGGGSGGGGAYANDLDAIIGATKATITSKFGQETFDNQIGRARNEADKINLVASVVLGKADSQTKADFANQAVGIRQIDKAIALLDEGVKTGALEAGAQYTYNLVGKDYDPKLAQINQLLTSAIQPYRNSVTGAAWGDQEDGEYQMLFGSTKYKPPELKQRLQGVKEILAAKSATGLNAYVNPMGLYDNQFERGSLSASGGDARSKADAAGLDYDAMKADGLSDQEIIDALK